MSGIIGGAGSKSGVIGITELDYEEGTWPGVAAGGTTAGSTTGSATGAYTKIGNLVTATISFAAITIAGASGNMTVTGLPFIAAESGVGSVKAGQMTLGGYPVSTIATSTAVVIFLQSVANNNQTVLQVRNTSGQYLAFSISYHV